MKLYIPELWGGGLRSSRVEFFEKGVNLVLHSPVLCTEIMASNNGNLGRLQVEFYVMQRTFMQRPMKRWMAMNLLH